MRFASLINSESLARVDHFAGQTEIGCHALANQARRALGSAVTWNQSEVDLGLTELRILAGDENVAGHRDLTAASECKPIDRHDNGFTQTLDLTSEGLSAASLVCTGAGRRQSVELRDVGARGKCLFSRTGHDDCANAVVALHVAQCLGNFP
jgi:hypothetical protein